MSRSYPTTDSVDELIRRIQREFPNWTIDSVFEFGSGARDEAVSESDIDLWFLLHSDSGILLDKVWESGRYKSRSEQFRSDYDSFDIVEIDTWGDIRRRVNPERPLEMSCPLTDTRWFLWQLAAESDWQTFLGIVFGKPLFDPRSFFSSLQGFLWNELPFHIHPDHGIVLTLKRLCESEKMSLMQDLSLIERGKIERPEGCRPVWLRFAVECIRDSVILLTLLRQGLPVFSRPNVMQVVESEFGEHLSPTRTAYWYKCTDEGRQAFNELLDRAGSGEVKSLQNLTGEIVELWHRIMSNIDQVIVAGESRFGFAGEDWRSRNMEAYKGFLAGYPGSFRKGI